MDFRVRQTAATEPRNPLSGVAIGLIVADAEETETNRVPTPVTNPHADWLWWEVVYPPAVSDSVGTAYLDVSTVRDGGTRSIRAMRKCEEVGQSLWCSVELLAPEEEYNMNLATSTLLILA